MRSNALRANPSFLDGMAVDHLEVEDIQLEAVTDAPAERVPLSNCRVIEIPMKVVIDDYPVGDNWCELVPLKGGVTEREVNHDCATC